MKCFVVFIIAMNIVTFLAFGFDKLKAVKGRWRISEATLILLSLCFGSVGHLLAMKTFRHKTQKWYFWLSGVLFLILHTGVLYVLFTNKVM